MFDDVSMVYDSKLHLIHLADCKVEMDSGCTYPRLLVHLVGFSGKTVLSACRVNSDHYW